MEDTTSGTELTRDMPPLTVRAAFRPGSINLEERTAEVIWTTGQRVKRGFWDAYWEELSLDPKAVRLDRLNNGAPLLAAHNADQLAAVIGVVESAALQKSKGVATVRFAKGDANPDAERAWQMVRDGILQNVSVGYRVYKLEQIEDGRARDDKTPVLLATDWEPFELSVVPMGADDGAGFRAAGRDAPNPCRIIAALKERSMADTTQLQLGAASAPATAAAPAAPTPIASDGARAAIEQAVAQAQASRVRETREQAEASARAATAAQESERQRIADIQAIVRRHDLGSDLEQTLIRSGAPIADVNAAVLRQLAARDEADPISGHVRFEAGEDKRDKFIAGACASIYARAGTAKSLAQAKKVDGFTDQLRDVALEPAEFGGMKLIDLARAALELRGVSTRGLYGEALVKRALQYRDAGMNTASDFAILLETAVNKTFLGQYAITPVTWRRWCGVKSVQDFRTATFYRPGSFGKLDKVSEGGEIKHKNIPDGEKATITAATVGNIIGITRKAIVNDDLGAFRDLSTQLGQAAAYTVESDAFALVTGGAGLGPNQADGQPLFHTNRSNIGPTGAMAVTTWDGAAAAMAAQKDPSKNLILDLSPAVLLCPRTLGLTAKQLNSSTSDPTLNKNAGVGNPVANMVRDIVATAQLTGTRHYFLADPGQYPVYAVGFIDGQEAPRIDSEQSFEYDGLQMKVILDYGTAVLDYRGAVTCAGA